ncbi:5'-3' exonuclease [Shouchella shacheensis]|uniref:5'-3' exonuclease n=1 Tax=Shouchella shacheensis TaxID=1649580 RepID=UPI0007404CFD|nr:5'-3' exonuclease [Shouchella shacheensis]
MTNQAFLLIDGFNLLSRGYFATAYKRTEETLSKSADGRYVNGLRVFTQKLFRLFADYNITHAAIAWDVKREESIRRSYFADYKQTRSELPSPLIQQYETCMELMKTIGVPQFVLPPYEADDIIGALAFQWEQQMSGPCYMYSNDRDLLQLLSRQTSQIIAFKTGERLYGIEDFRSEYKIEPTQWPDVKALLGDPSDNIPGCAGVGAKTALPLIIAHGSIEELYEDINALEPAFKRVHKKLVHGYESVVQSKELALIIRKIPELSKVSFEALILAMKGEQVLTETSALNIRLTLPPQETTSFITHETS